MEFKWNGTSFELNTRRGTLLRQDESHPFLYVGQGEEDITLRSGFSTVSDYVVERGRVSVISITRLPDEAGERWKAGHSFREGYQVEFEQGIRMYLLLSETDCVLEFDSIHSKVNRFWLRLAAAEEEAVYGGGEQFSYLNLRGRNFPLWTSEPGVGRDPNSKVTFLSNQASGNGGDYYGTYYPQASFLSTEGYFFHADSTAYGELDFRHKNYHEVHFFEVPKRIYLGEGDSLLHSLQKLSNLLGKQQLLPEFVYDGAILGLQGGTERVKELVERSKKAGIPISGLFCQDWCGNYMDPSFGKRLRWDFRHDPTLYPGLSEQMEKWKQEGIRFLGYINPYLKEGGELYLEAKEKGVLLLDKKGEIYHLNSGTIIFGMVDLSTEKGFNWYKSVIRRELLDFGLEGWMADFGEYLPADSAPASGEDGRIYHNRYPAEWARCNFEACKEAGRTGEILYFMRSGGTGSQKYTALQWQGDQFVDFSTHDGLPSAITGALSLTMSAYGLSHSDIGGYTSLFGYTRKKELFQRWAEFSAFTPVMRTHEGNNPESNFQYYDDEECMKHFARMVEIHRLLKPYLKHLVQENHDTGVGVMRPLVLHYEKDPKCQSEKTEYLLGKDLLVAPIIEEGETSRTVYIPGTWIDLWSGKKYESGEYVMDGPLGYPIALYRQGSIWEDLFLRARDLS